MPRRILVTGATGFLGRPAARLLEQRGWEVIGASSSGADSTTAVDLLDDAAVGKLLAETRPTHLLHAAWRAVHGDVMRSTDNLTWLKASLSLVQAFRDSGGTRAAVLGTSAEYDWREGVLRNNVTPMRPGTIYGACKRALHVALEGYARATNLSLVWPRVFFLYGPGEHESRLAASVVRSLLRGELAECTHGRQIRDYLYIDDVAAGIVSALESDYNGAIDIVSGEGIAVRDLVTRIAQAMGREDLLKLGARPSPAHDAPLVVGDAAEAATVLGWRPAVPLDEGIARTIAWGRATFARQSTSVTSEGASHG
jgi:nucleoside-diphosphate-sugar epimerase